MLKKYKRVELICGTLATLLCLAAGLSILVSTGAASSSAVQDMRGRWDGFVAVMGDPPTLISTEITSQTNRRFLGLQNPPEPVQPVSIEGTVSASGKVNYQGQSPDGTHTIGKTDLLDLGGGAAILNGSITRVAPDHTFVVPCVLVMRSFATNPPEPIRTAGRYVGNLTGEGVTGQIDMVLNNPPDPVRPTSFPGTIAIVINGQTRNYLLLGTANSAGRIVAIAHGTTGHLILDAVLAEPPDPVQPTTINGSIKLEFTDGSEVEGTFQTELVRSTTTS